MRRAVRVGDGWLPQGRPKMGMRAAIESMKLERAALHPDGGFDIGVNTEPIWIGDPEWEVGEHTLTGSPDAIAARLRHYRSVGASQMQVRFMSRSCDEAVEQIERFGRDVWPSVLET